MILEKFSLKGKSGIVTGGGSGIGQGMVTGLAEAGAEVMISGRNMERLKETVQKLEHAEGRVIPVTMDMADRDSIKALVDKAVAEFGKIDFLFNNAGTIYRSQCEDFPMEEWDKVIQVNLSAPFYMSQCVAKVMIEKGIKGKIINTASLLAVHGGKMVPAYAASKGGLVQATKTMCNDWGKYGINVNAIGPGWVKTDLTKALRDNPERFNEISSRIPLLRWADPEDLAGAAVFLASDASSYITGQVLFVDGGYLSM